MELSATSRPLTLGRKSVIPLEHAYTLYLAARAVDWLKVWLLGYRVLLATKHCNLLPRSAVFNLVVLLQVSKCCGKSLSFRTSSTSAASWFPKVSADFILILSWTFMPPTFQLFCEGRV